MLAYVVFQFAHDEGAKDFKSWALTVRSEADILGQSLFLLRSLMIEA
jgi:hypothetical protein